MEGSGGFKKFVVTSLAVAVGLAVFTLAWKFIPGLGEMHNPGSPVPKKK